MNNYPPIHLNSPDRLQELLGILTQLELNGAYEVHVKKLPKTRTGQQRKAIEVYCKLLADALNDGGYSVQIVLSKSHVDREWTQSLVKDLLWREIQIPMTGKKSTTELETTEVSQIYETLNRHTSNIFGVGMEFPHKNGNS